MIFRAQTCAQDACHDVHSCNVHAILSCIVKLVVFEQELSKCYYSWSSHYTDSRYLGCTLEIILQKWPPVGDCMNFWFWHPICHPKLTTLMLDDVLDGSMRIQCKWPYRLLLLNNLVCAFNLSLNIGLEYVTFMLCKVQTLVQFLPKYHTFLREERIV